MNIKFDAVSYLYPSQVKYNSNEPSEWVSFIATHWSVLVSDFHVCPNSVCPNSLGFSDISVPLFLPSIFTCTDAVAYIYYV